MKYCSIDGCSGKYHAKGFCSTHYNQYAPRQICAVNECTRFKHSYIFCAAHYARWKMYGDPGDAPIKKMDPHRGCIVEACDRKHCARGYCSKHLWQIYKYGEVITTRFDHRPAIIERGVAKIPLGINAKDGYTVVDKDDSWVDQYRWVKTSNGYVLTTIRGKATLLHDLLVPPPEGYEIDHDDRNPLNNRRRNLRVATRSQNGVNKKLRSDNTTGYVGVSFNKQIEKYVAVVQKDGERHCAGLFVKAEEAAVARDAKAKELFGEFAWLNFPEDH